MSLRQSLWVTLSSNFHRAFIMLIASRERYLACKKAFSLQKCSFVRASLTWSNCRKNGPMRQCVALCMDDAAWIKSSQVIKNSYIVIACPPSDGHPSKYQPDSAQNLYRNLLINDRKSDALTITFILLLTWVASVVLCFWVLCCCWLSNRTGFKQKKTRQQSAE